MVSGLRATGASYIINSAAITDIKTCEADPDYTAQINVTGACNFSKQHLLRAIKIYSNLLLMFMERLHILNVLEFVMIAILNRPMAKLN